MKNSYPVQLSEDTVQRCVAGEPGFSWWIQHLLRKFNQIIGKFRSKYLVRTHKFGVKIPKFFAEAKSLDEDNGKKIWLDVICIEMNNVHPEF